jgi:hydrogenase nickel incorporation protein HypB
MCDTCGCSDANHSFSIGRITGNASNEHPHEHNHDQSLHQMHQHKTITLEANILSKNKLLAERNRGFLEARNISSFNLVSSPGAGKTTLLEKVIVNLSAFKKIYVIEGDQQTSLDAERIKSAGAIAIQINTGKGCHLDAHMVYHAIKELDPTPDSLLFIENVGNLVCPALFDLGEKQRIVVTSTAEGDDKPLKYPDIFMGSHLCALNKIDILPYVDFDMENFITNLQRVNQNLPLMKLSAKTSEGLENLVCYIQDIYSLPV